MMFENSIREEIGERKNATHTAADDSLASSGRSSNGNLSTRPIEYPLFPRHLQGVYLTALDGKGHLKWCCCGLHISSYAISSKFELEAPGLDDSQVVSKAANLRLRTLATAIHTVPSTHFMFAKCSLWSRWDPATERTFHRILLSMATPTFLHTSLVNLLSKIGILSAVLAFLYLSYTHPHLIVSYELGCPSWKFLGGLDNFSANGSLFCLPFIFTWSFKYSTWCHCTFVTTGKGD